MLCIRRSQISIFFSFFSFTVDKRMNTEPSSGRSSSKTLRDSIIWGGKEFYFIFMCLFLSESQLEFLERWFYTECIGNVINSLPGRMRCSSRLEHWLGMYQA